jgi:hypothetical protein
VKDYATASWASATELWVQLDTELAGFGTQTAALAAGGEIAPGTAQLQQQQKNIMVIAWSSSNNLGIQQEGYLGSAGTQTAGLSFWWIYSYQLAFSKQQKNMMELLGQLLQEVL